MDPINPNSIVLKLRLINSDEFELTVPQFCKISDLKTEIFNQKHYNISNQRLIFKGTLLKDDHTLQYYNIGNGSVLHLLVRETPRNLNPEPANVNTNINTINDSESLSIPMNFNSLISNVLSTLTNGNDLRPNRATFVTATSRPTLNTDPNNNQILSGLNAFEMLENDFNTAYHSEYKDTNTSTNDNNVSSALFDIGTSMSHAAPLLHDLSFRLRDQRNLLDNNKRIQLETQLHSCGNALIQLANGMRTTGNSLVSLNIGQTPEEIHFGDPNRMGGVQIQVGSTVLSSVPTQSTSTSATTSNNTNTPSSSLPTPPVQNIPTASLANLPTAVASQSQDVNTNNTDAQPNFLSQFLSSFGIASNGTESLLQLTRDISGDDYSSLVHDSPFLTRILDILTLPDLLSLAQGNYMFLNRIHPTVQAAVKEQLGSEDTVEKRHDIADNFATKISSMFCDSDLIQNAQIQLQPGVNLMYVSFYLCRPLCRQAVDTIMEPFSPEFASKFKILFQNLIGSLYHRLSNCFVNGSADADTLITYVTNSFFRISNEFFSLGPFQSIITSTLLRVIKNQHQQWLENAHNNPDDDSNASDLSWLQAVPENMRDEWKRAIVNDLKLQYDSSFKPQQPFSNAYRHSNNKRRRDEVTNPQTFDSTSSLVLQLRNVFASNNVPHEQATAICNSITPDSLLVQAYQSRLDQDFVNRLSNDPDFQYNPQQFPNAARFLEDRKPKN